MNTPSRANKRERRHPAPAGDQETHQRDSDHEGQRPAKLGEGDRPAAPFIGDAVADVGLHARVEDVLAEGCQDQRDGKAGKARPEDHHGRPDREEPCTQEHTETPAAPVGHRSRKRADRPDHAAGGQGIGNGCQIHAQAARKDRQEGIDHPVQGVEDRPDDRKGGQLPAQGSPHVSCCFCSHQRVMK